MIILQSAVKVQFKHNSIIKNRSTSACLSVYYLSRSLVELGCKQPNLTLHTIIRYQCLENNMSLTQ